MSAFSLDTNVLIYAIDPSQGEKHKTAQALLERALNDAWPVALQVLGEFYSATTRKKVLTRADAARTVKLWIELLRPCAVSANGFGHALRYSRRTGAQFWDALILATCAEHSVKRLYTEDIGPQKQALGVALLNPFAGL
ncbi:MAG: hypothetical protein A3H35_14315 [Betaproteobacteria bacterium RIFCSPLOWO2_02_FULL_62_17]|nr:MAG: hypothetical protein A3H35_14315 [Betaproteobacteria bacterium RIFCSPLOWO2_02_FULL_62_17]